MNSKEQLGSTIGFNINDLLIETNKRQKDLAQYLGVTDNTISYFCSGSRIPSVIQLVGIANFFNVTVDYLVGRSKVSTPNTNLQAVCNYTGLSEKSVNELNIMQSNIDNTSHRIDLLDLIINNPDLLDLLYDYLLGRGDLYGILEDDPIYALDYNDRILGPEKVRRLLLVDILDELTAMRKKIADSKQNK